MDDRITVILGANDHGKSNVLEAIRHLNADHPFDPETDVNWDCETDTDSLPAVAYSFLLADEERTQLGLEEARQRYVAALRVFREGLDVAAEAAAEAAEEASAAGPADAASEDEKDQPGGGVGGEPDRASEAQAPDEYLRSEDGHAQAINARRRASLAYSLELLAEHEGRDEKEVLAEVVEESASAARAAESSLTTTSEACHQAEAALAEATQTYGAGTPEVAAATQALQDAEACLGDAEDLLEAAQLDLRRRQGAADAHELAQTRKLRFEKEQGPPKRERLKQSDVPSVLTVGRTGIAGELELEDAVGLSSEVVMAFLHKRIPRVELIRPLDRVSDGATREGIGESDSDFMRGIFRYAGIEPPEWNGIFDQSDTTAKRLGRATEQLNETLREAWSQGRDLKFLLYHENGEISLRIHDPAVEARYVRASRRSSGFTHFFALKTVLYAREQESRASAFIWLFDEPGIYLHPEGQHDLLQVLETLAQSNQIAYTTHSVFLVNKNHPARHRLLRKTAAGTGIDQKPFVGQWRAAIDALGLALPGSLLFASKVLLVEGDSEPIILNAELQKMIELGELDIDMNPLAVISTGDSKHADALIRILLEGASRPTVALLFDGDKGGKARAKSLEKLIKEKGLSQQFLNEGAIEDYVSAPVLYKKALTEYLTKLCGESSVSVPGEVEADWEARDEGSSLAHWARECGKRILGGESAPSSVGVAREYARLLADAAPADLPPKKDRRRTSLLAKKVCELLVLESQTLAQEEIVAAQPE